MKVKRVLDIVSVLIGTIVGAGFATGNEIYQFFARYGYFGYALVGVFFFGMFAFTYKIMHLAHKYNAYTIDELSKKVFGDKFAFIVNMVIYLAFFVFASVMMSAMSNIAEIYGVAIMIVLGFLLCIKDKQGILIANQIIIPLIFVFLIIIFINGYSFIPTCKFTPLNFLGIFGVFYYIALNELISLGALLVVLHKSTKKELLISALLAGFLISVMIVIIIAILNNYTFDEIHMPLKDVANLISVDFAKFTNLILFCTIFTTFLSSIFGIYKKIKTSTKKPILTFIFVLLLCYILSFVGFTNLVQYAYNIIGFVSLAVVLCFLLVKK